jgi:hypothetical protein
MIAFPLMAACAIALAARGQRLGLATLLVSIPTLYGVFAVIAFGIGVILYGLKSKLTSARPPCRKSARGFQ